MNEAVIITSIVSAVLTIVNLIFSIYALIELISFKKSTHRIEYRPLDIEDRITDLKSSKSEVDINKVLAEELDIEGL